VDGKNEQKGMGSLLLPLVLEDRLVQEHQEVLVHPVHPITKAIIALFFAYGLPLIYTVLESD